MNTKLETALPEQTGTDPQNWQLNTKPGQNGFDAEWNDPNLAAGNGRCGIEAIYPE